MRQNTERLAAGTAWQDAELVFTDEVGGILDGVRSRARSTWSSLVGPPASPLPRSAPHGGDVVARGRATPARRRGTVRTVDTEPRHEHLRARHRADADRGDGRARSRSRCITERVATKRWRRRWCGDGRIATEPPSSLPRRGGRAVECGLRSLRTHGGAAPLQRGNPCPCESQAARRPARTVGRPTRAGALGSGCES